MDRLLKHSSDGEAEAVEAEGRGFFFFFFFFAAPQLSVKQTNGWPII